MALLAAVGATARAAEAPIPRLVHQDGRHALFVNDSPYLILGA